MGGLKVAEVMDRRKTLADEPVLHLSKLGWEIAQIRDREVTAVERIFMSVNAAMTAWHLHEWLWKTTGDEGRALLLKCARATGSQFEDFKLAVQRTCDAIAICRQFATAHKHIGVKHDRDDVYYEVERDDNSPTAVRMYIFARGRRFEDVGVYTTALIAWARLYSYVGYPSARDVLQTLPPELRPPVTFFDEAQQ